MDNEQSETMWRTYETVNEWIRFSDAKAGGILAVNGIVLSILIPLLPELKQELFSNLFLCCVLIGQLLAISVSIYFSVRCLNPVLKIGEPNSLIFFGHIANKYKTAAEYKKSLDKALKTDKGLSSHVATQIWANSHVAWRKYTSVTWATRFLVLVVVLSVSMGIAIFL